jgi:hypothetical protein
VEGILEQSFPALTGGEVRSKLSNIDVEGKLEQIFPALKWRKLE